MPVKKVFTSGQVAKICRVAPRTVAKWFDSGKLQGYRIPGSQDRRIPRESLRRFLTQNNMPTDALDDEEAFHALFIGLDQTTRARVRALLPPDPAFVALFADDLFTAGVIAQDTAPDAVVVDTAVGRHAAAGIARVCHGLPTRPNRARITIAVVGEDTPAETDLLTDGFIHTFRQPFDPAALVSLLADFAERLTQPPSSRLDAPPRRKKGQEPPDAAAPE